MSSATLRIALCIALTAGALPGQIGGAGPSIMSRGGNASGARGSEAIDFNFFVGVNGIYDSGIVALDVDDTGEAVNSDVGGGQAMFGAFGGHSWRRSGVGLEYRGDYRKYSRGVNFDGSDHALSVQYVATPNRRWEFGAQQVAGTTSRPFGGFAAPSYISNNVVGVPLTEIYNARAWYFQTSGTAGYRWTPRLMTTFGGGAFQTKRSAGLVGMSGTTASASTERRFSRDLSIGGGYQYSHFSFPRAFGASDAHSVVAQVRRNIGRYSSVEFSGGGTRLETLGSESFALDPVIAAILGRSTGQRVFHRVNWMPSVSGTALFRKRQLSYTLGATHGANPGNGVYLTSAATSASAGVSYTGRRRVSFGASTSYTRLNSMWQEVAQDFSYYQVGGGMSWAIRDNLNFMSQIDHRIVSAGSQIRSLNGTSVSIGLSYNSSNIPLSLW